MHFLQLRLFNQQPLGGPVEPNQTIILFALEINKKSVITLHYMHYYSFI